ncbi:MAG: Nif3-like dinuclear metal center hexameric protein [Cyanobacteria bacterium SIG30]|nr:Nif3-like dinuclear metal center hexameric protein [Cyanobacteria bacterium SIG30]
MIKTEKIISMIESYASLDLAEEWDNSGWQINLHHDYTNKVMVALSFTQEVLEQAITNDCDLVVTHHPLIFDKLKKVDNNLIIQAIKHNISVYSAHTNLDKTYGSTTDALAGVLGLKNLVTLNEYVKMAHLKDEIGLDEFITQVKSSLGCQRLKLVNPSGIESIKTVAIAAGAGSSYIKKIAGYDIDIFITGDVKFHNAIEVDDFAVLDVGHFESELPVLPLLQGLIAKSKVEVIIATEHVPWIYV